MTVVPATGPSDLRDQQWLDKQVEEVTTGFDAMRLIAANWTDGRNLARLHPGVSAAEYVINAIGLTLGPGAIEPMLLKTNWSHRQIATVTGVSHDTVDRRAKATGRNQPVVPRLGADGKVRKPSTTATAPAVGVATTPQKGAPIATPVARPVPPILYPEQWAKVRQAISIILAADDDQVIAVINGYADVRKRRACANLMRSTAIRMNRLRKEVNP